MHPYLRTLILAAIAIFHAPCLAQVPQLINFQGRIVVEGVNFDSTIAGHNGLFRFALVKGDGTETYWSNDGTSAAGSEPVAAVPVAGR